MSGGPPLAGVRVVVTRAAHQAAGLAAGFTAAGAEVALLPLLEVVPPLDPRPLERAASELPLYDWVVFTSANAVAALLPPAGGALPARVRAAAVGEATAAALRAWEVESEVVAGPDAAGLLAELGPRVGRRQRVLLPQAADARGALAEGLAAVGAEVVAIVAYDKRLPADAAARAAALFAAGPLGWVTFTSPRLARHFAGLFGTEWEARRSTLRAASIGEVTTAALRHLGVEAAAEADSPSDDELVAAVVREVLAAV